MLTLEHLARALTTCARPSLPAALAAIDSGIAAVRTEARLAAEDAASFATPPPSTINESSTKPRHLRRTSTADSTASFRTAVSEGGSDWNDGGAQTPSDVDSACSTATNGGVSGEQTGAETTFASSLSEFLSDAAARRDALAEHARAVEERYAIVAALFGEPPGSEGTERLFATLWSFATVFEAARVRVVAAPS